MKEHEVRDANGNLVGRYWTETGIDSEAFHRAQRAEIDALEAGRAHEGTFAQVMGEALGLPPSAPWPPRQPTSADRIELEALQNAYAIALRQPMFGERAA